jgi:hypothetical protein
MDVESGNCVTVQPGDRCDDDGAGGINKDGSGGKGEGDAAPRVPGKEDVILLIKRVAKQVAQMESDLDTAPSNGISKAGVAELKRGIVEGRQTMCMAAAWVISDGERAAKSVQCMGNACVEKRGGIPGKSCRHACEGDCVMLLR